MTNSNKGEILSFKDSIVETPEILSNEIYKTLHRKPIHNILDLGCFRGNLTKPFRKKKDIKIIGLDVIDTYKDNFDSFIHKDFLETTKEDFKGLNIDIIISNPPFNLHKGKGDLYPMLFIQHCLFLFGKSIPMVFVVGHWLLSNSYKRMDELNKLKIGKITTIHKGIFKIINPNISVECSILYINIKTHTKHSFLSIPNKKEVKKKEKRCFKSIVLTPEQKTFLDKYNFNELVKDLLIEKFGDKFPS